MQYAEKVLYCKKSPKRGLFSLFPSFIMIDNDTGRLPLPLAHIVDKYSRYQQTALCGLRSVERLASEL